MWPGPAMGLRARPTSGPDLMQAMKKYGEAMKDLKQLLETDQENSAALSECAEVKQLWEKQLRQLQATKQQQRQREKKTPHASKKKKSNHTQRNKIAPKEKEKLPQQTELEQLLAETKSKMKKMKEDGRGASSFTENPLDYLTASKTTYYKEPKEPEEPQTTGRRRKVVIEEADEGVEGEGKEGRGLETPSAVVNPGETERVETSDPVRKEAADLRLVSCVIS